MSGPSDKVCVATPPAPPMFYHEISIDPKTGKRTETDTPPPPKPIVEPKESLPPLEPKSWHSPEVELLYEELGEQRSQVFASYSQAKKDCKQGLINTYYEYLTRFDQEMARFTGPDPAIACKDQKITFPHDYPTESSGRDVFGVDTKTVTTSTVHNPVEYFIVDVRSNIKFAGARLATMQYFNEQDRLDALKAKHPTNKSVSAAPPPPKNPATGVRTR